MQIMAYHNTDFLVDVQVQDSEGIMEIYTFDSLHLPSHLEIDFLSQLFEWAYTENFIPWSCHGDWPGKHSDSKTLRLLPLFLTWIDAVHDNEKFSFKV